MKKIIGLIVLFILVFSFISNNDARSTHSVKDEVKEILNYEEIIDYHSSREGQLLKIMRADTDYKNPNGTYIILNFNSIRKEDVYVTNSKDTLENVIIIENVSDINVTRNFLDGPGYITLIDDYGKEISTEIWTQTGKEFSEIILVVEDKADFDSIGYLKLGGLDRSKNDGLGSRIFIVE